MLTQEKNGGFGALLFTEFTLGVLDLGIIII